MYVYIYIAYCYYYFYSYYYYYYCYYYCSYYTTIHLPYLTKYLGYHNSGYPNDIKRNHGYHPRHLETMRIGSRGRLHPRILGWVVFPSKFSVVFPFGFRVSTMSKHFSWIKPPCFEEDLIRWFRKFSIYLKS